jgi:O-antigen chain-terminating methyltransferase
MSQASTKILLNQLFSNDRSTFISNCYHLLLERTPDDEGAAHYSARLEMGKSQVSVIYDIAKSQEFISRNVRIEGLRRGIS